MNQDPLFADSSSGNFTLQSGSPAIDAGGGLTLVHATDIGSGTSLVLEDAHFFQPGWGGTEADAIAVGTLDNTVQITSIDYDTDTITLANTISRNDGDPVWLFKDSRETPVLLGCAPDIGALESPADAAPRVCSIERQTPAGATTNADSVTFRVKFDETVVNVDAADFALSGTSAGDGTIGAVGVQSGRVYDVPVSGLGDSNGTLNLDLAGVQNIAGALGNPLTDLTPTVTEEEYTLDNDSPVISSVTSINVTETSADIQWSTNEAADSQVEYGLTTTYGTTTPLDARLGTSHSENLSGLSPNTLDHYRVLSRDALGNLAVSADFTVSTDITPPTVAITFPLDGATVTGTIVISGTAFDNTALSVVDVQIDGGAFDPAVGLDSWTFSLDTTALSEGIHTVTSRATDTGGNTTTDSISIDVNDTKSPSVTALNPLDGAVDVAIDAILALTFDEPVAAGIGNIEIRESIGDALFETIDVTSGQVIIVDDTVTVDPAGTLAHAAGYYLLVDAGAFTDLATNDFPGIGDATGWNFATVVDTTQPTITGLAPADDAVDVAIDATFVMTFDEPVAAGAGAIEIRETVGDALFESIDITSGQVTVVGTTVTVDPAGTLAPLTGYYVLMDAGAITDQASTPNEFAGIADTTAWSITIIAAPSPPTITGLAPTDDAVDVAIDATFVMTFDEPVAAGAGNIEIRETVGDALFESIDSTSGQVTVVGTTVTVDPAGTLTPLTGYYLLIDAGAITDQEANQADFAGIGDTTTWNFMTGEETTPPTITGLAPADDAVHVAIDATFVMTFDEPVAAGAGNIEIRETVGDALFESIDSTSGQVTVVGTTVTVDPAGTLAPLTGYYVLMDAGAITDQANTPNEFAGIADTTAWSITIIAAPSPPTITGLAPTDDAVDVAIDATFVMTFDEPVAAGAGNIEIRETVGDALFESIDSTSGQVTVVGTTVTVDPAGTLTPLTGYYLLIDAGAITDQEANQADFAGIGDTTTWNFMTGEETTPPTITGLAPADDAVHVAIDATFVMTFDEPVAAGAGNIEIRETVGDALFESIDSTSGQVTVVGTTVTVDPAGTLAPLTGYYVLMDAGAITDQANTPNEFAGIADTTAWSITTASTSFGDQLQGLWKLDDGSGGTALDSSGNDNHGTLNGDFLWTTEGIGGSLNLDGDGDYVTVGVGSQYSDLCINGCSFGGWIKPNGQPAASRTYGIIGRYDYTDADMFFRLAYNRWGRLFAFISYDGTITNRCRAISGYDFAFDRWQHVFVVFDGSTLKLYLDGVEEGSADCGFVGIDAAAWQDSESTFLGAFDSSDTQGEINAALDEIAMFNRALSPAELLDIYTNGVDAAP